MIKCNCSPCFIAIEVGKLNQVVKWMSVLTATYAIRPGPSQLLNHKLMQYVAMLDWKLLLRQFHSVPGLLCWIRDRKNITLEVLYHISIHQLVRASRIDFWSWRNQKKREFFTQKKMAVALSAMEVAIPGRWRIQKRSFSLLILPRNQPFVFQCFVNFFL